MCSFLATLVRTIRLLIPTIFPRVNQEINKDYPLSHSIPLQITTNKVNGTSGAPQPPQDNNKDTIFQRVYMKGTLPNLPDVHVNIPPTPPIPPCIASTPSKLQLSKYIPLATTSPTLPPVLPPTPHQDHPLARPPLPPTSYPALPTTFLLPLSSFHDGLNRCFEIGVISSLIREIISVLITITKQLPRSTIGHATEIVSVTKSLTGILNTYAIEDSSVLRVALCFLLFYGSDSLTLSENILAGCFGKQFKDEFKQASYI